MYVNGISGRPREANSFFFVQTLFRREAKTIFVELSLLNTRPFTLMCVIIIFIKVSD